MCVSVCVGAGRERTRRCGAIVVPWIIMQRVINFYFFKMYIFCACGKRKEKERFRLMPLRARLQCVIKGTARLKLLLAAFIN